MPKAYSVFKQNVHNVSAHKLQQQKIEICWKNDTIVLAMNSCSKSFCIVHKMFF